MQAIQNYQEKFIDYLTTNSQYNEPKNLYAPINYILNLGGKRLRPVLTLLTAELFNSSYKKALPAALAIEVFHNFSLVHDDIMDNAPLRRGKQTVHELWDVNTGILSGDAMLILAYQLFENYQPNTFVALAKLFSKTALQVCEGQQYDIDFETQNTVSEAAYIKMITYKTAVLVAAAMQMGAIIAQASQKNQTSIYEFGKYLGIAFQLQDDYLDAFGNPETFGKQVGGDIIENKKTYLFIKALEFLNDHKKEELLKLYSQQTATDDLTKINNVKTLFTDSGAKKAIQSEIKNYTSKAFSILEKLDLSAEKKQILIDFGNNLMQRRV